MDLEITSETKTFVEIMCPSCGSKTGAQLAIDKIDRIGHQTIDNGELIGSP